MDDAEKNQKSLDELNAKGKLSGAEKGQKKALEKAIKTAKAKQNRVVASPEVVEKDGKQRTTGVSAKPIRLLRTEKTTLQNKVESIKSDKALINELLGGTRHINETKIIRALIRMLPEIPDRAIVETIRDTVKDDMFSR